MGKFIDLSGRQFGRLFVVEREGASKSGQALWKCRCVCGNEVCVEGYSLRSGNTKSCGCLWRETITRHGFHEERLYKIWERMNARCYSPKDEHYDYYGGRGITVCNEWRANYPSFRNWAESHGYDKDAPYGQCTLTRIDKSGSYCPENCHWTVKNHGGHQERLYGIWEGMKTRCYNPNCKAYSHYGGRGITVCEAWLNSYPIFRDWALLNGYDDSAPRWQCTIDRIDNDKGYSPDNCRWVDMKVQRSNQRRKVVFR